jgi:hypothetical protein
MEETQQSNTETTGTVPQSLDVLAVVREVYDYFLLIVIVMNFIVSFKIEISESFCHSGLLLRTITRSTVMKTPNIVC